MPKSRRPTEIPMCDWAKSLAETYARTFRPPSSHDSPDWTLQILFHSNSKIVGFHKGRRETIR